MLSSLSPSPAPLAALGKGKLKTRQLNNLAGIIAIDAEIIALLPFLSCGALSLVKFVAVPGAPGTPYTSTERPTKRSTT